jgi:glyoxylase-like metal-dependent hydrolase (beta-lactamase superfamily II)
LSVDRYDGVLATKTSRQRQGRNQGGLRPARQLSFVLVRVAIFPPSIVNPMTDTGFPPGAVTIPAAPFTSAGRAKLANRWNMSARFATAAEPRARHPRREGGSRWDRGGDAPVALADDLLVIPVPGHTGGSGALLYGERFLLTGDHLWGDARGRLSARWSVCWYDWGEQTRSIERLLAHRFEWVPPGHGRPWHAASATEARQALAELVTEMRRS